MPDVYTSQISATPVIHENQRKPRKRSNAKWRTMWISMVSTIASEA